MMKLRVDSRQLIRLPLHQKPLKLTDLVFKDLEVVLCVVGCGQPCCITFQNASDAECFLNIFSRESDDKKPPPSDSV